MNTFQTLLYQTFGKGGNCMFKLYEIFGTVKPILKEKELNFEPVYICFRGFS